MRKCNLSEERNGQWVNHAGQQREEDEQSDCRADIGFHFSVLDSERASGETQRRFTFSARCIIRFSVVVRALNVNPRKICWEHPPLGSCYVRPRPTKIKSTNLIPMNGTISPPTP